MKYARESVYWLGTVFDIQVPRTWAGTCSVSPAIAAPGDERQSDGQMAEHTFVLGRVREGSDKVQR